MAFTEKIVGKARDFREGVTEKISDSREARAEKAQEKRDEEYDEMNSNIQGEVRHQYGELATNATTYISERAEEINTRLDELKAKTTDLSDEEEAEKAKLMKQAGYIVALAGKTPEEQQEFYTEYRVTDTRDEYAKQLAARMDKTLNIKTGKKKHVDEAHKAYMVAVGVMARFKINQMPSGLTGMEQREAKLKLLVGDPTDPDDLGERGLLELQIAEQRKLQSSFYDEKIDPATGKVTAEYNDKHPVREMMGKVWRKWSKPGWKGKAAKIAAGATLGLVIGLTGGAAGIPVALGAGLVAGGRVLKSAGTVKLNQAGNVSAADEDAQAQLERLRVERGKMFDDLHNTPHSFREDRMLWDARDRANALNKTHKRTASVMGASALLGGGLGMEIIGSIWDGTSYTGAAGKGVKAAGEGIGNAWESVFGESDAGATAGHNPNVPAHIDDKGGSGPQPGSSHNDHNPNSDRKGGAGNPKLSELPPPKSPDVGYPASTPITEHVVTGSEMNGKWIEQVYRSEGLTPKDYLNHAKLAMNDGELVKVPNKNGTFHYRITNDTMKELGLKGNPTSTENIMKVLAKHSGGAVKLAS